MSLWDILIIAGMVLVGLAIIGVATWRGTK